MKWEKYQCLTHTTTKRATTKTERFIYRGVFPYYKAIQNANSEGLKMSLKFTTKSMKNLPMDDGVYLLRRKVMAIIYEAKKLTDLPRINVRITEDDTENKRVLGRGQVGGSVVLWIPKKAFKLDENDFKYVVMHEIIHTAFNQGHTTHGLMRPIIETGLSSEQIDKLFIEAIN